MWGGGFAAPNARASQKRTRAIAHARTQARKQAKPPAHPSTHPPSPPTPAHPKKPARPRPPPAPPQVRRIIPNPTAKHTFPQLLARAEGERHRVAALADLLDRMMALDPEKRIDPDGALRHPFVKDFVPKKRPAGGAGGAAG